MRGRKPKPTALHELHGNPRHLARETVAKRRAVEPPDDPLAPPVDLTAEQEKIWVHAVRNAPPGVLRGIDTAALMTWVVAFELHARARRAMAGNPLLVSQSTDPHNRSIPIPSPYLSVLNRQAAILLRACEQLGFSPTSRPRLAGGATAPAPLPSSPAQQPINDTMSLDDYIASAPPIPKMH
jgi:phage terminase small subunit